MFAFINDYILIFDQIKSQINRNLTSRLTILIVSLFYSVLDVCISICICIYNIYKYLSEPLLSFEEKKENLF